MRLGMLVRQDKGGLGYQSLEAWRHLKPAVTVIVDLGQRRHPPSAEGWYGDAPTIRWDTNDLLPGAVELFEGCDVVWSAETFYDLTLTRQLADKGIGSVLHANVELHDGQWASTYWAPTPWLIDRLPNNTKVIPVPAPTDRYPDPGELDVPLRIVHPAGFTALADRNGTAIVHHTRRRLESHGWHLDMVGPNRSYKGTPIRFVTEPWERDPGAAVSVIPRRYGGLCLPALEAAAAGVPVIMPDTVPNSMFTELRTQARKHTDVRTKAGLVPAVHTDPGELAGMIEGLLGNRDRLLGERWAARGWALAHSWDALGWRWWEGFEAVVL